MANTQAILNRMEYRFDEGEVGTDTPTPEATEETPVEEVKEEETPKEEVVEETPAM